MPNCKVTDLGLEHNCVDEQMVTMKGGGSIDRIKRRTRPKGPSVNMRLDYIFQKEFTEKGNEFEGVQNQLLYISTKGGSKL